MAKFESNYSSVSVDSMESRKRKLSCHGVPLPYLIRPRRKLPPYDIFSIYNDYAETSDNESNDEDNSSMEKEAVETEKKGLGNESNASLSEMGGSGSDDEYVIVNDVEAVVPDSKTERKGAIQMMDLSKDVPVDESETESEDDAGSDTGSNSGDDWVVV